VSDFQGSLDVNVRSARTLAVGWLVSAVGLGAASIASVYYPLGASVGWIEFSQSLLFGFLITGFVTAICAIRFAFLARSVLAWLITLGGTVLFALLISVALILMMMAGGGGPR
jgi:hypothetical protein